MFAARFDGGTPATLNCVAGTPGEDVIQLEAAEYRLAAGGGGDDGNESGDLDTGPSSQVRIVGRGLGATVVAGSGDRTFDVFAGASLALSDLTVRDSAAPSGSPGGAIRSRGTLLLLRIAFINTAAGNGVSPASADGERTEAGEGGAIWSAGSLTASDVSFTDTRAGDGADARAFTVGNGTTSFSPGDGGSGGAVLIAGGAASLTNVTVAGARAGSGGDNNNASGFFAGGSGGDGGAIAVTAGAATITNSTFQGNRAGAAGDERFGFQVEAVPGSGGAVHAAEPGAATVTFSTFSGNAAGGSPFGVTGVGASVSGAGVASSILADARGACASLSVGRNVVLPGDTTCPGGIAGDPLLGPLAADGGSVPTMAPGPGSPAIDAIVGVPCPATDARGLPRPRFAGCDAGAVEVQPGAPGAPCGQGGPGGGAAVRAVSGLKVGPAAFRASGRRPLGTTVTFRLSAAGPVVLTVRKAAAGTRSGRRCVAPTRRLRNAKRCVRQVTLAGRVTRQAQAGLNAIRFTGRLRGRALPAGAYTLVVTLPDVGARASRPFRILR
ncbi:choice-of-anchor Q domain-containing protein [Miltoncostaea oceani]|uniref:choice-of-anchor Q domain-containing protein n=1 Tax=Miltoncostaea oceani TaxID=2843216 RepID=UPI001C3CA915|nr:choice-of-anchor Q domain-containing protein [Miltoncostaea oceani]